jgi:regulatory protein
MPTPTWVSGLGWYVVAPSALCEVAMAFKQRKVREPLGEAGLFEYAVGMLGRQMRTERELRRLMQRRAVPGDEGARAMDAVVARLKELNYLSDPRFAADYTRLRMEGEKFGRRRVQQDLAAKGVASETVGKALGEAYAGVDEVALARQYVARKRMKQPSGENARKESAKVMGRLLRAGFSAGTVFKVLREWGVEVEEVDVTEGAEE